MNHDRYLQITRWADRRYRIGSRLIIQIGLNPTRYKQIETLAFNKYVLGELQ